MNARERAILFGKDIKPATLDESALAYAVAHGGGDAPTYETVAEIQVGTMTEGPSGLLVYESDELASIPSGANYYFNSTDYPLTEISEGAFVFGIDTEQGAVEDPAFGIWVDGSVTIIRSTEDLSNTTVRILKKVEQGGGTGGLHYVTAEATFPEESTGPEDITVSNFSEGFDAIAAAIKNGETPVLRVSMEGGSADCYLTMFVLPESEDEEGGMILWEGSFYVFDGGGHTFDLTVVLAADEEVQVICKERAGESGVLIVEATGGRTETIDGKSVTILSVSTPAKTVADAIKAGRPIDLVVGSSGNGYGLATRYPLALELWGSSSGWSGSAGGAAIMHSDGETVSYASINVREDGNGGYEYYLPESTYGQITGDGAQSVYGSVVPLATSADAGKVLTVNSSGRPAWVTPT